MRAKLWLSFLVVVLIITVVNGAIYYYVVRGQFFWLYLSAGLGIAVGAGLGYGLSRSLTGRIAELAAVTRDIAAGDLTREVRPAAEPELEQLAQAFRTMVGQLAMVVARIQGSAGAVSGSAASLSATAQQMSTSGQEIASATEHIGQGRRAPGGGRRRAASRVKESAADRCRSTT